MRNNILLWIAVTLIGVLMIIHVQQHHISAPLRLAVGIVIVVFAFVEFLAYIWGRRPGPDA